MMLAIGGSFRSRGCFSGWQFEVSAERLFNKLSLGHVALGGLDFHSPIDLLRKVDLYRDASFGIIWHKERYGIM